MSRQYLARQPVTRELLGALLRRLREERELPLRKVAAAADVDSTHLSKIELGQRLPTSEQAVALEKFFNLQPQRLETMRLVETWLRESADNPALPAAATMLNEAAGEYHVNKVSAAGSKRAKPVNKRKKTK